MKNNNMTIECFNSENIGSYVKPFRKTPVYGPIDSRRLDKSLGINILKQGYYCNFSCIYCECGLDSQFKNQKLIFYELSEIKDGLKKRLASNEKIDTITMSGMTEPTLYPKFGKLIDLVTDLRDTYSPNTPTALFTNGYKLDFKNLNKIDKIFVKLDVGTEEMFQRFNRPKISTLNNTIKQIIKSNTKMIQSIFVKGADGNISDFDNYIKLIKQINPDEIQLYTLLYAYNESFDLHPLSIDELKVLSNEIKKNTNSIVKIYTNPVKEGKIFVY